MAESKVFELVCEELEGATSLSALEARGTVRISLKQAGLDANNVTIAEMVVMLERVLAEELGLLGVADSVGVVSAIASALKTADLGDQARSDSPEAVFSRLGG